MSMEHTCQITYLAGLLLIHSGVLEYIDFVMGVLNENPVST